MFMKKAQFVKVYNELTKEQIEKAIQCKWIIYHDVR